MAFSGEVGRVKTAFYSSKTNTSEKSDFKCAWFAFLSLKKY